MIKSIPVSEAYKRILSFVPSENQCLLKNDVPTIKNLSEVIIYIRYTNGNGFWCYIKNISGNRIYGYRMNGNWWNYIVTDIRKICTYY